MGSLPADLAIATCYLAVGVLVILHPYAMRTDLPGDFGDSRFSLAMLEFFYQTLMAKLHGQPASFLGAPFFYPWPDVTSFSETFWGTGAIYALLRVLGAGMFTSFRLWFVLGYVSTYAAAFVSLRKSGLRPAGAGAGAFLFSFALPMAGLMNHVQLVYRLWIPPATLALDRCATRRSLPCGAACILFVALQLATSIYLGLLLALFLACYLVSVVALRYRSRIVPAWKAGFRPSRSDLAVTIALLAAGIALLLVVAIPYLYVQALYGFSRGWQDVVPGLPRPASYLLTGASRLWPDLSNAFPLPGVIEPAMFPGLAALVAIPWFLLSPRARGRQPAAAVMMLAAGTLFAITLDLDGHTLFRLVYLLPGFSVIRAATRVILVMMMPLAALFGMMIDDLGSRQPPVLPGRIGAFVLCMLAAFECSAINYYDLPAAAWQARQDALQARLPARLPPHAILAVAAPTPAGADFWPELLPQTDALLAAAALKIHTLNGYSGNNPPSWQLMTRCDDVAGNLRAGRHFLFTHGFAAPGIAPDRLVLLGFPPSCDPVALSHDPQLTFQHVYRFGSGATGNMFADSGFASPEAWGRWTDRLDAFLFFSLDKVPTQPIAVIFRAIPLATSSGSNAAVTVFANGHSCGRVAISASHPEARVMCPPGTFGSDNALQFRAAKLQRPVDLGIDADTRRLGLGFESVELVPSP